MASELIDKKFLAGLKFKSSEKGDDGRFTPTKRPLTQADVLDWKDNGATVVIVAGDGQKHTVNKKAAEKNASDDEKDKK